MLFSTKHISLRQRNNEYMKEIVWRIYRKRYFGMPEKRMRKKRRAQRHQRKRISELLGCTPAHRLPPASFATTATEV